MRKPTFVGSSIITCGGGVQVHDRRLPVSSIELAELLLGANQADLKTFDLAQPALLLCLSNAVDEVVADLDQRAALGGIGAEKGAADAGVFVDAGGVVGAGAGADGESAAFEVAEEVFPFRVGGGEVLLGWAQCSAARDEGAVGFDGLGG